jgi:hypothetical protein
MIDLAEFCRAILAHFAQQLFYLAAALNRYRINPFATGPMLGEGGLGAINADFADDTFIIKDECNIAAGHSKARGANCINIADEMFKSCVLVHANTCLSRDPRERAIMPL